MSDEEKYGVGDAAQFFGYAAPWTQDIYGPGSNWGEDVLSSEVLRNEFDAVNLAPGQGNLEQDFYVTDKGGVNTSYGEVFRSPTTSGNTDFFKSLLDRTSGNTDFFKSLLDRLKGVGGKAADFATSDRGIASILAALAAYKDRAKPSGGGTGMAYAGPKPLQRQIVQGKYGPIAQYAAQGGIMHAYAQGGKVQMEDGGFVMTKKAVDSAGGPQGIAQLLPGARMIGGPLDPTGRRDLTPAVINGPHGQTPAQVSRGEAYVPKRVVEDNGGAKEMYALMHSLQRRG